MSTKDELGREFDQRPWGSFTVIDDQLFDHKVKRLVVNPGQRLSYQRHVKRAEHWFVVNGVATVTLDGVEHEVPAGSSIDVALGQAHRVENRGASPLIFIEVQHGTYFGEDDIERIEDDYGRVN
ncbi:MAG TPA: phosphomannose isomerase type II C-terminal cupin domain [Acidimicrobiales bacterium]|nr:phosphomannose isomerase type II C-terminal cupin domain [Acidimicrobiales bacterium]